MASAWAPPSIKPSPSVALPPRHRPVASALAARPLLHLLLPINPFPLASRTRTSHVLDDQIRVLLVRVLVRLLPERTRAYDRAPQPLQLPLLSAAGHERGQHRAAPVHVHTTRRRERSQVEESAAKIRRIAWRRARRIHAPLAAPAAVFAQRQLATVDDAQANEKDHGLSADTHRCSCSSVLSPFLSHRPAPRLASHASLSAFLFFGTLLFYARCPHMCTPPKAFSPARPLYLSLYLSLSLYIYIYLSLALALHH